MDNRVIVYTPEPASGAARYVSELVKSVAAAGASVLLFCPSNFAYAADLAASGVSVSYSATRETAAGSLFARVTRNLRFFGLHFFRQLSLCRPGDVFHVQFPLYFPLGLVSFILARTRGSRVVFTAHDPVPHKWLLPEFLRTVERGALKLAYRFSDLIIVHNEADRNLLIQAFGQPASKISVVPHGPLTISNAAHPFSAGNRLELLLFGSIREDKGIHLAVEAIHRLNMRGKQVRLTIAGAVANARESDYWERCKTLIARAGDCIRVEERFIADDELPRLIADCHAMLLPYTGGNSESGVAALALANQRAIIARNVGGLGTLLSAADLGIAIESPTPEAIEHAIEIALSLGLEALRRKGKTGAELMSSTRSWAEIGRETVKLYGRVNSSRK
ncbi:MAG: glycosyltransferase family 4 protein [Bryobacteraceae bacterium]